MQLPDKLLRLSIKRGTILHSTMFENIDHGKFFVIIGVTDNYIAGFFFINSNINRYILGKQEQLDMQFPLRCSDYPFLNYDSFLSATRIEKIPVSRIVDTMQTGITTITGQMHQEHLSELLSKARGSILFSARDKRLFFS